MSLHYVLAMVVVIVNSQTTICVWNSIDFYDYLNGEYTKSSSTYSTKAYWERYTPDTCAAIGHPGAYVFAGYYAPDQFYYWTIHSSLDSSDLLVDDYPECGNDWEDFPAKPSGCLYGWQEWLDETNFEQLALTVTDGSCPVLSCPFIEVTNSGIDECDGAYRKSSDYEYVYIYNGNISPKYLYFNIYQFKWFISDTLGIDDCKSEIMIDHHDIASLLDKWKDVNIGESFTLRLTNNEVATLSCVSSTKSPSKPPTASPTKSPVTKKPTEAPIRPGDPTKAPSDVTQNPSVSPTDYTEIPTFAPTAAPTAEPSDVPTKAPIVKHKVVKEVFDGDDEEWSVAKQWNITIQSSLYTVAAWGVLFCMCLLYVYRRRKSIKRMQRNARMMNEQVASQTGVSGSGKKGAEMSARSMTSALSAPSYQKQSSVAREAARRNKKKKLDKQRSRAKLVEDKLSVEMSSRIRTECEECGLEKYANQGKTDDTDGLWYCYDCWRKYEQ